MAKSELIPAVSTEVGLPVISKCRLCGSEIPLWRSGGVCDACENQTKLTRRFNQEHFRVPSRYQGAELPRNLSPLENYLLIGPARIGKTHAAYGILRFLSQDPRQSIAAYSWPKVLLELRQGYNLERGEARIGEQIVKALRQADVALIDDLGAEKYGQGNLDWLQENLFVILDDRYAWKRQTILTSNVGKEDLSSYLGPRVASRVQEWCQVLEVQGRDGKDGNEMSQVL